MISFLAAFSLFAIPSVLASPAGYWVVAGATGNGTSEATPAGNITYVLTTYAGTLTSSDVIKVKPGTYNAASGETFPITINVAGLIIESTDGAGATIIDGGGAQNFGIKIEADGVTLRGFTIKNFAGGPSDECAIYVLGSNVKVDNNIIEDIGNSTVPDGLGIDVFTNSGANTDIQITNNTVHDIGSIGIRVRDDWRGGQPWTGPTGISRNVLVEGNTVYRAGNSNILITGFAEGITVRDNEIYDSSEPNRYGIRLCIYPSDVTIEDNYIHGNYRNIVIAGADDVTISNNRIEDTPSSSKNIYIMNNYNIDNGQPWVEWLGGITVNTTSTNISIANNDILNAGYGVKIENFGAADPSAMASTTTINWNNIVGNTEYGLENTIGTDVNATLNWWGDRYGPYHSTTNPRGTGDKVSNNVDYEPWLDAAYPGGSPTSERRPAPPPKPVPEFNAIGLLALIGILTIAIAFATLRKRE